MTNATQVRANFPPVAHQRTRALVICLLLAVAALIGLRGSSVAVAASSQQAYPKYLSLDGAGASVSDSAVQGDSAPGGNLSFLSGRSAELESGLFNSSHTSQAVTAQFSVQCYNAAYAEVNYAGPSIKVTVPGDPSTIPGDAVMARVQGTLSVPTTCVHHSSLSYDGIFIVTVSQYGMSGAADVPFVFSSTLPGPGFPAAGATGAVVLFRAVDSTELAAIKKAANRYTLGPGDEGKYFFLTKAEAEALATKYEGMGLGSYTVTSASIADSALASTADSISLAGEGTGYFIVEEGIAAIGTVSEVG